MQRLLRLALAGLILSLPLSGCGPSVSQEELGEIQYEIPRFPAQETVEKSPDTNSVPFGSKEKSPPQPAPQKTSEEAANSSAGGDEDKPAEATAGSP